MGAFWENFEEGNAAAVETMGETVVWDGEERQGIVSDFQVEEGAAAGGRKTVIGCRVQVATGTPLRDGLPVTIRGAAGRVNSWETMGPDAGMMVSVGPVNRWSGDGA